MKYTLIITEEDVLDFIASDLEHINSEIVLKNFKPIIVEFEVN